MPLLTILITSSVSAQESESPPRTAILKQGDKAPFDGQLLNDIARAQLLANVKKETDTLKAKIEYLEGKLEIEKRLSGELLRLTVDTEKAKLASCESSLVATRDIYEKAISRISKDAQAWYRSPYLNFALGAVVFGGAAVGLGYLAR